MILIIIASFFEKNIALINSYRDNSSNLKN